MMGLWSVRTRSRSPKWVTNPTDPDIDQDRVGDCAE